MTDMTDAADITDVADAPDIADAPDVAGMAGMADVAVPHQRTEEPAQVTTPRLPDLGPAGAAQNPGGQQGASARDMSLLADIPVQVAVEIGRLKLPLRELLSLEPGAVLELDRPADAPVDVLVNGRLVAHGEVVVIDGEFGVRVTDIVDGGS